MKRRKPLNQREAAAIAQAHLGPRGGVRIVRTCMVNGIMAEATMREEKQIIELKSVGQLVCHGEHPTSWRKAFEDAGIFNI